VLRFDLKGGMYLSGGVDSSVVAYHLKKQWKHPRLEAFGLNFPNQEYSEYHYSEQVAKLLDIDLHEVRVMPEKIPELAAKVVYHTEQPHGDFSFFLFYLLAQCAIGQGKTVMFTGDGPDETMAGQQFHKAPPADFSLRDYFKVICYMSDEDRKTLLNPDFENSTPEPFARLEEMLSPYSKMSPVDQIVAYEATSLLPGNNLVKGDRMGSAWSTESRSPFLDHRISECFVRLPDQQKFCDGFSKYYFKRYAATKLPHDLIFKKKSMPTLPIGEWIKTTLYEWTRDALSRGDGTFINKQAALKMLDEHTSGARNHTRSLRTILMTQLWIENCVKLSAQQKAA
jgi:asparagine synthase (glutamine-hydrolysing)